MKIYRSGKCWPARHEAASNGKSRTTGMTLAGAHEFCVGTLHAH